MDQSKPICPEAQRCTVALRVRHPDMSVESVEAALRMKVTVGHEAGAPRTTPRGDPLAGSYEETYCSFRLLEDRSLIDALRRSVSLLNDYQAFFRLLRSRGGSCELFVGWFGGRNFGETLDRDVLASLVDLELDLALDVYGPDERRGS